MITHIWRGNHEPALAELVARVWQENDLLILCPPHVSGLSWVRHLPMGEVEFVGETLAASGAFEMPRGTAWDEQDERPVFGLFTSGTTREPRLVLCSKRNVEAAIEGILSLFDSHRIDSVFCYPQPFHTFGLVLGYVMAHLRGYRHIAAPGKYSKAAHLAWIREVGPGTLTLGTPTHFHDLIDVVRATRSTPHASYSCIIGGAPTSVRLWHEVQDVLRIEAPSIGYGCTEASPGLTHLAPGVPPTQDGEIGVPLPRVDLRLLPDLGIEFSGPNACLAVVEGETLTFPSCISIADVLEERSDGCLLFRGRADHMLNRGGTKYSLEDIERVIQSALGAEALCVAVPDLRLGEDLAVVVVGEPTVPREGLVGSIREILGRVFNVSVGEANVAVVPQLPGDTEREARSG